MGRQDLEKIIAIDRISKNGNENLFSRKIKSVYLNETPSLCTNSNLLRENMLYYSCQPDGLNIACKLIGAKLYFKQLLIQNYV